MFVCCECCVLSGRGLCDELMTCPEESYRLWCVVVCDLEISRMRRSWPAMGRSATRKKNYAFKKFSITTSTISDSNRNKNIIQHYNQGKPTDYAIKNVLINSRSNTIRRAVIITKIFRIFDKFLTMHTDGFSCDSILRTRHVSRNCRTQRSIMYNRPTQQF